MAMAIAMIAYTDDSMPDAVPDSTVVAGPVLRRRGDLLHRAVLGAGEVLGEPAHHLGEHQADDDGAEALPALVVVVVADVEQRDQRRADDGDDAGGEEPTVDRLQRVGLALLGTHGVHAGDRGDHADGTGGHGKDQAERRVGADRCEGRHTEDDRGDEGDLVGLEEVGGHAGAVADVVAHVVGDRRRVAGVVLGDARLDLADEVGADVGGLGEDAAADAQEQGDQRAAEAEADEDGRARVLEQQDDDAWRRAGRGRR